MQPGAIDQSVIAAFAVLLVWAGISDVRSFIIPNRVTLAALALYPGHLVARYVIGTPVEGWPWAVAIAAAVLAVGALLFAFNIMGGGDVKLLAVCVLWAGPALAPSFILLTAVVGGGLALLYLMWGRYVAPLLHLRAFSAIPHMPVAVNAGGKQVLPYGMAIAVSGLFVVAKLSGV